MTTPRVVADIMTRTLVTLKEEDDLRGLREGLDLYYFRHLPVVDGERLVGLVSHRDVLRFSISKFQKGALADALEQEIEKDHFVAEIMTRNPATVTPNTPLADAASILIETKYGALPVVEGDKLVGIVTEHDFMKLAVTLLESRG